MIESDLQVHRKHIQLGVQENRISKYFDEELYTNLAVLDVKTHKHPLTFQDAPVYRFEPVTAVGYAWGATVLTALQARIDIYDYAIAEDEAPGIVVQNAYIGGMSGGPVVDESGAVVSIAQRAYSGMGFGVGTKLISAFLVGVR